MVHQNLVGFLKPNCSIRSVAPVNQRVNPSSFRCLDRSSGEKIRSFTWKRSGPCKVRRKKTLKDTGKTKMSVLK